MSAGYVYVLANSSLPGLVKVGKTSRSPAERAQELSGPTGVATPFLVVYEQFFEDCDVAEAFVHTGLMAKNLRVSENREFFRAQPSDVIKIIMQAPGITEPNSAGAPDGNLLTADDEEFASLCLDGPQPEPWDGLMEEAEASFFGFGDHLKDQAEALRLYRQAAAMGSPKAYERLGVMFHYGFGVMKSDVKALEFYKEGAKRGNYYCYATMAILFFMGRQKENARKCFLRFIEAGESDRWSYKYKERYEGETRHLTEIVQALVWVSRASPENLPDLASRCIGYKDGVQAAIAKMLESPRTSGTYLEALRTVSEAIAAAPGSQKAAEGVANVAPKERPKCDQPRRGLAARFGFPTKPR